MTIENDTIVPFERRRSIPDEGGGNGGGREIYERLARIETDMKHMATEASIEGIKGELQGIKAHMQHMATKAWILGGVIAGMGLAASIALAVARLFAPAG